MTNQMTKTKLVRVQIVAKADTLAASLYWKNTTPFDVVNWLAYSVVNHSIEHHPNKKAEARLIIEHYGLEKNIDQRIAELKNARAGNRKQS